MPTQPRREQLADGERGIIIGMRKAGTSYAAISRELELNSETIRQVYKFYETTGFVKPSPRSGRPSKLNECDRQHLKRHIKRDKQY
jgi:transposase